MGNYWMDTEIERVRFLPGGVIQVEFSTGRIYHIQESEMEGIDLETRCVKGIEDKPFWKKHDEMCVAERYAIEAFSVVGKHSWEHYQKVLEDWPLRDRDVNLMKVYRPEPA